MLGELLCSDLGEANHGPFAGRIGSIRSASITLAGNGGDIDNPTAAARQHLPGHTLQTEKHPLGVDAMDAVPVFLGEIHDIGAACHASVVHQDVDRPKSRDGLADHAVDVL